MKATFVGLDLMNFDTQHTQVTTRRRTGPLLMRLDMQSSQITLRHEVVLDKVRLSLTGTYLFSLL